MSQKHFRILIALVLILFVVVTLALQSICAPDKNPISAAVSSYVEKSVSESRLERADPLSYEAMKRALFRWALRYCKR